MASTQVYATVQELRVRIERTRTTDDTQLLALLTAASRSIDNACNRARDGFVAAVTSARQFAGSGLPIQRIDECAAITLVETKPSTTGTYEAWDASDWFAFRGEPRYPVFGQPPYTGLMVAPGGSYATFHTGNLSGPSSLDQYFLSSRHESLRNHNPRAARGVPTVRVTAAWGYALTCPPEIREATVMQAAIWYKQMQGAMTDTLADAATGTLIYERSIHPSIKRILVDGRYIRKVVS
jgi:hypothetical protein